MSATWRDAHGLTLCLLGALAAGCGASHIEDPTPLPQVRPAATKAALVMSEVQYDLRVVPAQASAFMEAFGREVFAGMTRSGFLPGLVLERDAIASAGPRRLVRLRVTDFREVIDAKVGDDDDMVEIHVAAKVYDATGLALKPAKTVDASVSYESNMFDTTATTPTYTGDFKVRVVGALSASDSGTERSDFSRALTADLGHQLVKQIEPAIRAKLGD